MHHHKSSISIRYSKKIGISPKSWHWSIGENWPKVCYMVITCSLTETCLAIIKIIIQMPNKWTAHKTGVEIIITYMLTMQQ